MSATSVTGVGQGAAFPGQKGPSNGRNTFVALETPHVVAAGSGTLAGGTLVVTFPTPLENAAASYAVMVTSKAATTAYVSAKTDVSSQFASFTVTGTGTATFDYAVISVGVH